MALKILIADDSEDDIFFVNRAFKQPLEGGFLHAVFDGREAISYLEGHGRYADRGTFPLPDVIITDLRMSRLDGFRLLKWLRAHKVFHTIPTLVLTSSLREEDAKRAYEAGADAFLSKPIGMQDLSDLVLTLKKFESMRQKPGE